MESVRSLLSVRRVQVCRNLPLATSTTQCEDELAAIVRRSPVTVGADDVAHSVVHRITHRSQTKVTARHLRIRRSNGVATANPRPATLDEPVLREERTQRRTVPSLPVALIVAKHTVDLGREVHRGKRRLLFEYPGGH